MGIGYFARCFSDGSEIFFGGMDDPLEMNDLSALPEYAGEVTALRQEMQQARLVYNDVQPQGQRFWARYEAI